MKLICNKYLRNDLSTSKVNNIVSKHVYINKKQNTSAFYKNNLFTYHHRKWKKFDIIYIFEEFF